MSTEQGRGPRAGGARAALELAALLRRAELVAARPPAAEAFAGGPTVRRICAQSGQIAGQIRRDLAAIRAVDARQLAIARERIRRRGAAWVSRTVGQLQPLLGQLDPRDIDLLVGCLARVEHAVGRRIGPLERLRRRFA